MKPSEVLLAARELVAGGWTKGASARNRGGKIVPCRSREACQFCAEGAILRAGGDENLWETSVFFRRTTGESIVGFNDIPERTHLDVVLAFERAALLAMKEGR